MFSLGLELVNCVDTDWLNKYGDPIDLKLQPKQVLHGLTSLYKQEQRSELINMYPRKFLIAASCFFMVSAVKMVYVFGKLI